MTQGFAPVAQRSPPECDTAEIAVAAPPEVRTPAASSLLVRLLPVVMSLATLGIMAVALFSGPTAARNPTVVLFPIMMLGSLMVTAATGCARQREGGIDADRLEYLCYLSDLRQSVAKTAGAQSTSLNTQHPHPQTLWTLIGGKRMWERQVADSDFCVVRVGVGSQPLATRLSAPETQPSQKSDPVTLNALRHFLHAHSTVRNVPIALDLRRARIRIDGDPRAVRGLLRALICQLAVLHAPDQLLIVGVIGDGNRTDWDWLKWLPHNQHPSASDAVGSVRMVYATESAARQAVGGLALPYLVLVIDSDEYPAAGMVEAMTVLQAGTGQEGAPLTVGHADAKETLLHPDQMDRVAAVACARRLAGYRVSREGVAAGRGIGLWPALIGIGDVRKFDPNALWLKASYSERLRVPLGTTVAGTPLELDIKQAAENGLGPHGLCVGATGSGKSELLRTVALGMMVCNAPEVLNLLLIDFKGGATFLGLTRAPHVAAVITNLAEEAPLVARMRDALAGEMNRRQQLLRTAGNYESVAAYEYARLAGAPLAALPTLFIIVDEFSELLSQHPDFVDMFVTIGRLGRSLGMHLLLASQRLDEGRLRGLEAHLSYRLCLKTLSAGDSRTVLGTADAYHLPNTPGAGFLRSGTGELIGFQAAIVSGPLPVDATPRVTSWSASSVQPFTTKTTGAVAHADAAAAAGPTIMQAVLERLAGCGPPAHQVWLPPLDAAPALQTLLRDAGAAIRRLVAPIGIVDRPFDQCRTPLLVDLTGGAGNVAVVGAPQSGKSTALRTLITALAATHDPRQVQFYCLDFGGGTLDSLRALPHVGAVAGRADLQLAGRMITQLEGVVHAREAHFREHGIHSIARYRQLRSASDVDPFGDVFLVIDGWAALRHEFESLEEPITALAAQGLAFGVHVVLSASRWAEIRPSLRDQLATRIELRLGDPADSHLDRQRAQQVPRDRPGRGLSDEGLHMMIALPRVDRIELQRRPGEPAAPRIRLLPTQVHHDTILRQAGDQLGTAILLGLEEGRLQPVSIDFERNGHLLILGDNECGKTNVLRTLCREIVRTRTPAQAQLLIIDFRRGLLGVVESDHLGGYAVSPAAVERLLPDLLDLLRQRMPPPDAGQSQLRTRSWWSGADMFVVVDDYDLVATPSGNPLTAMLEYLPHATDLGLHLIVARRSGGSGRAMFEPVLAGLRDLGCSGLMMSGRSDEGAWLGSGRPVALPPGRGILVTRAGDEQLVQVAWSPPLP